MLYKHLGIWINSNKINKTNHLGGYLLLRFKHNIKIAVILEIRNLHIFSQVKDMRYQL